MKDVLKSYSGKKVLVTGGAGFIGSHLVEKLLELGAKVSVVDIMLCGNKVAHLMGHKDLSIHEVDVTNTSAVAPLFAGQDIVFHLAAVVGVEETQDEPVHLLDVEVGGTASIIALAAKNKVKRFVFASSSEVYGDSTEPMVEEGPFNPKSTYALCKLIGEHYCQAYYKKFGLEFTALRYFNSYGPRQDERFVLSRFIKRALNGQELFIYGDGEQTRDFTFVGDAVAATIAAATRGRSGRVYNIGGGARVTVNQVLDRIAQISGRPVRIDREPDQKGEMRHTYADTSLAREELGFAPRVSLEEGLKQQYCWLQEARAVA